MHRAQSRGFDSLNPLIAGLPVCELQKRTQFIVPLHLILVSLTRYAIRIAIHQQLVQQLYFIMRFQNDKDY